MLHLPDYIALFRGRAIVEHQQFNTFSRNGKTRSVSYATNREQRRAERVQNNILNPTAFVIIQVECKERSDKHWLSHPKS